MSEGSNQRIGDYLILNELGSGGMGRVYRVRNVISDRIEAMKILLPDLAGRQELAERFLREIKLMASLNHPNIATLRTAFTADNQLVMIMEYVEGSNLAERLEHGPLPVADAVNYAAQVLGALSYAHKQGVIHRDIKPSNMMLTPEGIVKLMDFGIARGGADRSLTMTGTTLGSLAYMSPEQVKGEATDARSDLYSTGVSLYEMVTGQRPFQASSDYSIMAAHVKETPKPPVELQPGLPPALNEIILMAIAKDPGRRFQTADAFCNALGTVQPLAVTPAPAKAGPDAPTADSRPVAAFPTTAPAQVPVTPITAPVGAKAPTIPVPTPLPTPPPPAPSVGHRGLYMMLGALVVLVGLVLAGLYLPSSSRTHAKSPDTGSSGNSQGEASGAQPASQPAMPGPAAPSAASSDSSQPPVPANAAATVSGSASDQGASAPTPPAPPADTAVKSAAPPAASSAPARAMRMARESAGQASPTAGGVAPSQGEATSATPASAASNEALEELEHEIDQLSNRAAAISSGLDRLQQQQASSGYGLRGDMVERGTSMNNNLAKATDALHQGDIAKGKKYTKMAEGDIEVLEKFLGH